MHPNPSICPQNLPQFIPLDFVLMENLGLYAIHSGLIEQVIKIKAEVLADIYRQGHAELGGKSYPLHNLSHVLGNESYQPEIQPYNAILFLRSGDKFMAMHVDELLGNHDMVVKTWMHNYPVHLAWWV